MSADQFFYVVFSTFTNREIIGLLTYYYSDVLMYSLIFGVTLLATGTFSMNNCMMYRDAFLVFAAVVIHIIYVFTKDANIIFGSFGLYLVYVIMDWKNDALTHIGLKMLGKIKDDDSFEGDYPLTTLKRKRIEMTSIQYDQIEEIISLNQERFERNLRNHEIYMRVALEKQIRTERNRFEEDQPEEEMSSIDSDDEGEILEKKKAYKKMMDQDLAKARLEPLGTLEQQMLEKRIAIRMRFAVAVYKHIFFLRHMIEEGQVSRYVKYNDMMIFINQMQGSTQARFPQSMKKGNIDEGEKFENPSDDEDDDNKSQKSGKSDRSKSPRRKSSVCKLLLFS